MAEKQPRRPGSEGFKPVKQVGVATSLGAPTMAIGLLILGVAFTAQDAGFLWWLGGGITGLGVVLAMSGRVI
jgi:hypothetical protein